MRRRARFILSRWLALSLLPCLLAGGVSAQDPSTEEPRWLRFDIPQVSLGLEAEGLREDVTLKNSGTSTHDYLSVTPLLGLKTQGSIYHPDLMAFSFNGEGGLGWLDDTVKSPGSILTRHESSELFRYLAQVNFLANKPYNASFFAEQDHTYQNYDFFNTATVDSLRYGGRVAYSSEAFNLSVDTGYRDEQANSFNGYSDIADTYLNFNGINHRARGNTTLTYSYDKYNNQVDSAPVETSVNQSIGVSDTETLGDRDQIAVTTGANYSLYQYFVQQTETLNGTENVTVNHLPNLDSFYTATYDHNTQEPASSELFQGMAGLRHRLYESLASTLDVHGVYDDNSSSTSSGHDDRYGVGLREDYTKRVGSWGRLSLGGSLVGDHEDHEASGTVLSVIDEAHTLYLTTSPNYRPAYLNNPRVITATIQVLGPGGVPVQENLDYQVIQSGELTEIRLVQGSTVLRDGASVLVSYESESLYTSSFETLNANAQVRLDILNIFGVYGRLNWIDNNAPPQALAERLTDLVGGVDATWRWVRTGAEYEDFDSTFAQYKAWRFFETFNFQPAEGSNLGFDFNQIFYRYPDGQHDDEYQFLSHLDTRITPWLSWNVEGGYFLQDVFGTQQNLAAARTGLVFQWGKLTARVGYQYNYQLTEQTLTTEQRDRNFFFASLRRVF